MAEPEVAVAPLVRTAAARFAEELRKRYGQAVLDVRLFGSFARGEASPSSTPSAPASTPRAWSRTATAACSTCGTRTSSGPACTTPATSRLLARLQKFREEADYARAFVVDEPGAREEIEAAGGLVERIRRELA